ncbi:hypothetical protein [Nostoc sp. ChiQUE01b]|uniref:hypothetical protein n=1 Tax=Nostoc sp. ChiQUE01b TaxID=3075376 RepID=UPI002AD1EE4A|nr:hypothetical protein [Nostoc sp. ChiQUE01b]MDZ8262121.1 hypothetical protein [Nostoc sp. ChiQUE01b]
MNQTADFFVRSAVPETTRSYMGGLLTFLATSAETGNRSFLLEVRTVPGAEPPPSMEIPANATTYADSDPTAALAFAQRLEEKLNEVIALAAKYGVKMLTPEETAELLPHYPGFGVPRL